MPKIYFEGRDYDDPEQMTPEARQRYEKARQLLPDVDQNGIPDLLESNAAARPPQAAVPAQEINLSPEIRKATGVVVKNRKWILAGCIIFPVLILACVLGVIVLVFSMLRSSGAYQLGLTTAQNHPAAQKILGTPIKDGFFTTGSVNESSSGGEAQLVIPVEGQLNSGRLYVEAVKTGGSWRLISLILEVDHEQQTLFP